MSLKSSNITGQKWSVAYPSKSCFPLLLKLKHSITSGLSCNSETLLLETPTEEKLYGEVKISENNIHIHFYTNHTLIIYFKQI